MGPGPVGCRDRGSSRRQADTTAAGASSPDLAPARSPRPTRLRQARRPREPAETEQLRAAFAAAVSALNGAPQPPPASASKPAAPGMTPLPAQAAPPALPRPACPASFDMSQWRGKASFADQLVALRAAASRSGDAGPGFAALAEFYVANAMPNEALAAVAAWQPANPSPAARERMARAADLALLLRGETLAADSPLLADPPACQRGDLPLWRALAAAANGDPAGVARDGPAAGAALTGLPEPVRSRFALALADAAPTDAATLQALADAVRNAQAGSPPGGEPEDKAARLLIRARLARAKNSQDERKLLTEAARESRTIPGLQARLRLAELDSAKSGPAAARAGQVLMDFARTYRGNRLGESAALTLAQRKLAAGDYAGALDLADASTAGTRDRRESRGAGLALAILRILFVDPHGAKLPAPAERLALYWRFEGYATPGEKGDDVRLGALRLMLDQGLPDAARDVARGITPATARAAIPLVALAEARAAGGDPAKALAWLDCIPPSAEGRHVAATALKRLGRTEEAARQLDGLPGGADQTRRAALLFAAGDWREAAAAYAALLRAPGSIAPPDAGLRDALARALSDQIPGTTAGAQAPTAAREIAALGALPPPPVSPIDGGAKPTLAAFQGAIARARHVERLLSP
jgi:hypothetical protein